MTESIPDRLAAEIKRANSKMEQTFEVFRAWEKYRDGLANAAREFNEWLNARPPLPELPGLPQEDALSAPGVVDSRAQVAALMSPKFCPDCGGPVDKTSGHLLHTETGQLHCGPADPDATGVHHVPEGASQTVPDGGPHA